MRMKVLNFTIGAGNNGTCQHSITWERVFKAQELLKMD